MAQKGLNAGTRLTAAALDGAYAQGVIAQGNRQTAKALTASEAGVLRLDSMSLKSGNTYWIVAHNLRAVLTGNTTGDRIAVRLRYNSTANASTSDNEIGRVEWTLPSASAANYDSAPVVMGWVNPTADTTAASVLLTALRVTGSGTSPSLNNDPGGLWLNVIDLGVAVPNTGVVI